MKVLFYIFLVIGLLGISNTALGATIFEDNFNSYTDGDLNGQGGWVYEDISAKTWYVEGTTVYEGTKATAESSGYNYLKDGTLTNDGRITVYLRWSSVATGGPYFTLYEGTAGRIATALSQTGAGKFDYYSAGWKNIGDVSADTWYCLEIEWRSSDHKVRYKLDGGAWTNWVAPWVSWTNGLSRVRISGAVGRTSYVDYIAENPYVPSLLPSINYSQVLAVCLLGVFTFSLFNLTKSISVKV